MNKPQWKDAPEWAEWLAMDRNGSWYWYEFEPTDECDDWSYTGKVEVAYELPNHYDTLEQRP